MEAVVTMVVGVAMIEKIRRVEVETQVEAGIVPDDYSFNSNFPVSSLSPSVWLLAPTAKPLPSPDLSVREST